MKKRLWILVMILAVLGLAGCQNTTQASDPEGIIAGHPAPKATKEPIATVTSALTNTPKPTATPAPTNTPKPTATPAPTSMPKSTATPAPTNTPKPTATPAPTSTSKPTTTLAPMNTPKPTLVPLPTVTPRQENEAKDRTGILFSLPEDMENCWENEWMESETNERIIYKSDSLPKKGTVSVKFCYPNVIDAENRGDTFELILNNNGNIFTVRDTVEKGVWGEGWTYYEAEGEYTANGSELEIVTKTHSRSGREETLFAIADIKITNGETGESAKVDLTSKNVNVVCTDGYFVIGNEMAFELFWMSEGTMITMTSESKPTATPTPTATPRPTRAPLVDGPVLEHTGVIIALPDDSKQKWMDSWTESETSISIVFAPETLPTRGRVTVKLCYPNGCEMSERSDSFGLYLNGQSVTFSNHDCKQRGRINNQFVYMEASGEYNTKKKDLKIRLETHSSSGSEGVLFGIADIVVTDLESNERHYVDLTKANVELECQKNNYENGGLQNCSYEIREMKENKIVYAAGKVEEELVTSGQVAYEPDSKLYSVTYKLPETSKNWEEPWYDSEANIIFRYVSEKPLSNGTISLTMCVPKGLVRERKDAFELAVHGVENFFNYATDDTNVTYANGHLYAENRQVEEEEDCYKIRFNVDYDNSKVGYETDLKFIFKSHSTETSGAYEVTLCDVIVEDKAAGTMALDLSASNLYLEGKMYRSQEAVEISLSNSIFNFYIMNGIGKMGEGTTHVLEIYNSDNATLDFTSSDSSVASVDTKGKITAHKKGTCEITVKKGNTGESKSFTLTVLGPQVVLIEHETLLLSGTEIRLEAMTEYGMYTGKYKFTSSDATIATVDTNGLVKAKKDGVTTITVTDTVNDVAMSYALEVYTPEDKDGVGQYIFMKKTGYVTADIAKRSYQLLYDVYKNVFDYFNYGEYEDVTLYFTVDDYSPAYSDSRDVYLASEHMLANAKDVDCITHELIHCAQNHISVGDHVWLMEGLTDYGRYLFGLHNEDCGWSLPEYDASQHYTDSYGVTAAFIKFVTDNYCADMPHIINKMFKGPDGYDESIWKTNTGHTIDELWELYSGN